jgi:putative ABC transport system ATP-binding protein
MKIVICEPAGEKREFDLEPGTSVLGRDTDNEIVVNDNQVSRKHARILVDPKKGSFAVEDLKSTNGVYLNETRIQERTDLKEGDVITIGGTSIEVKSLISDATLQAETIAMKPPRMVVLEQATKVYQLGKYEVKALRGVDLEVEEGEFISVCGPSGSGKSTLLNLIGCIDTPTSGKVSILGKDISEFSDAALSKLRNNTIGFIFQTFNLIPVLTAFENVEYPLVILGMSRTERVNSVASILKEVGLEDYSRHRPDELSGGQRQRVAIARALVTGPKMVLADEPTANLDSVTGIEILELMNKMNGEHKTTFIFSTHDPKIEQYARKVYTMLDGALSG